MRERPIIFTTELIRAIEEGRKTQTRRLINPQPNGDLYVMRSDGSDVRMLTDDQFEDGTPSWLPISRER